MTKENTDKLLDDLSKTVSSIQNQVKGQQETIIGHDKKIADLEQHNKELQLTIDQSGKRMDKAFDHQEVSLGELVVEIEKLKEEGPAGSVIQGPLVVVNAGGGARTSSYRGRGGGQARGARKASWKPSKYPYDQAKYSGSEFCHIDNLGPSRSDDKRDNEIHAKIKAGTKNWKDEDGFDYSLDNDQWVTRKKRKA